MIALRQNRPACHYCRVKDGESGDGQNHCDHGSVDKPVGKQTSRTGAVIAKTAVVKAPVQRAAGCQQFRQKERHRQQDRQRRFRNETWLSFPPHCRQLTTAQPRHKSFIARRMRGPRPLKDNSPALKPMPV